LPDVTRKAAIGKRGALALLVLAVVTFLVVDVIEGPVFSLSTRTWPAEVRDGKVIAGIEGAVKAADRATGTVRIASGFLGLNSVRVVVTPQTEVAIHGKFGSLADLDRGQLVRVAYEVLPDRLLASRVDVLDRLASSEPPRAPESLRPAESVPSAEPVRPAAPVASVQTERVSSQAPSAAAPAPSAHVEAGRDPALPLATRQGVAAPGSTPKRAAAVQSLAPRVETQPTARPVPPPAAIVPAPPPVAPRSSSADDGSDAVDWLLKSQSP
jgi:hypothetical protein